MKKSRLDALVTEQEGLPELTREDIKCVQLKKLNILLGREKERGGFYKALPSQISSLDELKNLPFTTDEDLAAHAGGILLSSQSEIQRVLSDATSGTTGSAKRVFYTEGDCENTVRLFAAGLGELVFPGSVTMICMPFSGAFGLGELISEAIIRLGARPLRLGGAKSYGELKAVLEKEKPDTYVGMPVPLLSLLRVCGRGSLRHALISGDACPDTVTREIESILHTKLFPHYGSREMGLGGAVTCPAHEGMHLRENHIIAEIVDEGGNVLPDGEYGELVITTVGMQAMPLIRYKTGDHTRILKSPCPCGSALLRLDTVTRKGEPSKMLALDEKIFSLPDIVDYKAERRDGRLHIDALTMGESVPELKDMVSKLLPDNDITLSARRVSAEDRPLYPGKRTIL